MTNTQDWHLRGEYFENCNCEVLCPCLLPGIRRDPTEGHCDMAFAFHIEEGEFSGVTLNGLNFVVAMYTPGNMTDPNWTMEKVYRRDWITASIGNNTTHRCKFAY